MGRTTSKVFFAKSSSRGARYAKQDQQVPYRVDTRLMKDPPPPVSVVHSVPLGVKLQYGANTRRAKQKYATVPYSTQ